MKKRIISALMCLSLIISINGCGKKEVDPEVSAPVEAEDVESYLYNIAACLSESNPYNNMLYKGFSDAVTDYLGEEHIKIKEYVASDIVPVDYVTAAATSGAFDLVFTVGKPMLNSCSTATDTTPIIATGIVDFQSVLRIANSGDKAWNKTTGINVSGVSSKPAIVDQVSLLIEATKDLQAVGILFSPEDQEAIYQNELFEKYLDQAGIPWKEYMIPASSSAIIEEEEQNTIVLPPSKIVAQSAKAGIDNNVFSLGTNSILGINSPSSTRVALISKHWTGGKIIASSNILSLETEDAVEDVVEESPSEEENVDEGEYVPTLEDRISEVCNECSAIYIPYGSMLTDQVEKISSICTSNGVVTVGGDTTIGQNTLVTLFYDPYSLGYMAGKKAVKVLQGADISTMKVSYGNSNGSVKLYNKAIAEELNLDFPKSFSEIDEFLESYEYGSTTKRHISKTEEESDN